MNTFYPDTFITSSFNEVWLAQGDDNFMAYMNEASISNEAHAPDSYFNERGSHFLDVTSLVEPARLPTLGGHG
jgi:hypothetical protein